MEITLEQFNTTYLSAIQNLGHRGIQVQGAKIFIEIEEEQDISDIVSAVIDAGGRVISVRPFKRSLEEIYLKLIEEAKR